MKFNLSLITLGLSVWGTLAQRQVPPEFKIGVKWQIEIQNTIDVKAPLQPTDAVVWDLDLYHIARTPDVVTHLRVRLTPFGAPGDQYPTHKGT